MRPELSPSVSKAASHHRLALNPKPNAPQQDVFFYCSSSSTKLMPFVQDQSAIASAFLHNRPLIGVCPMKSMIFAQLLKEAKIAAALAPTPAVPSTPATQWRSSSEQMIFGAESSTGDGDSDAAAAVGLRADTPAAESEAAESAPKVTCGILKAMARIDDPDHSFVVLLPVASVAVIAIEVCEGACPDEDFLEALRGIGSCVDRCVDMAGVFESCISSSQRMSAIASTSMTQAHSALLKAAKRLLQCSVVQVYDVEWSRVGSGARTDQIPCIRCIAPDGTQTGSRGPPLPPGMGAVWRAVVRAELVLVKRCADDAVFRRGIDCPYDSDPESAIVCPCVAEGQVVGAVSFVNKKSGLFLLGDSMIAEMLSRAIGISIAAARQIASERASAEEVMRGVTKHCASLVRTAG
jgi:GAF domain-containing protein